MKIVCSRIALLIFLFVFEVPKVNGENDKIKIIVPHKISYVHHHHQPHPLFRILKSKKKYYLKPEFALNYYKEDESEEEEEEESDDRLKKFHGVSDEEPEGSHKDVAYYAIPATRVPSNTVHYMMKPVFFYNDNSFHKFKHPPSYAVVRYSSYMDQDDYPEDYSSNFEFEK